MKIKMTCLAAAALLASAQVAAPSRLSAQSELDAYLAERRAAAMTEGAESQIRSIASILAGGTVLVVEKDPDGSYARMYSTALCLRPGDDSPERHELAEATKRRTEAEFQRLKTLADFDKSGFVTGEEGHRLREVIEFGLVVDQLP